MSTTSRVESYVSTLKEGSHTETRRSFGNKTTGRLVPRKRGAKLFSRRAAGTPLKKPNF